MTTELKVGSFVIGTAALLGLAWAWTYDGVRPGEESYDVFAVVPSAEGLWKGTPVRLAGVEVGAIESIEVDPEGAKLALRIRSRYALPVDTSVELRSSGMLGDRFVTVIPGRADKIAANGASLPIGEPPLDLDAVGREVQAVASEIGVSAAEIRVLLEQGDVQADIKASLATLATLTADLATLVRHNRADVDAAITSIRRVGDGLDQLVVRSAPKVDASLDELKSAAEKLDQVLDDLGSISAKLDRGDGTVATLINDRQLVDRLDGTLDRASTAIDDVSAVLQTSSEVRINAWTSGRLRLHPTGSLGTGGTVGLEFGPNPDLWLSAELVAEPEEMVDATGAGAYARGTVLAHKRWGPASVRAGMREGSEGIGLSGYVLEDRLMLSADAFDFTGRFDERPTGVPDLRLGLRASPLPHLWFELSADELLLTPQAGGPQPWLGVGIQARPAGPEK